MESAPLRDEVEARKEREDATRRDGAIGSGRASSRPCGDVHPKDGARWAQDGRHLGRRSFEQCRIVDVAQRRELRHDVEGAIHEGKLGRIGHLEVDPRSEATSDGDSLGHEVDSMKTLADGADLDQVAQMGRRPTPYVEHVRIREADASLIENGYDGELDLLPEVDGRRIAAAP
jgi:hypothetical protein